MQWNSTLQIHNSNTPLIIQVYLNGIEQMLSNLKMLLKLNMVFSRIIEGAQEEGSFENLKETPTHPFKIFPWPPWSPRSSASVIQGTKSSTVANVFLYCKVTLE